MSCPNCKLSFHKNRKPYVFPCGHSFCQDCLENAEKGICLTCHEKGKAVINLVVLESINKKNNENIDKYIKVCLFGNMNVGKSSIIRRLVDNEFEYNTNPTIGIDFKYIDQQLDGKLCRFQIWDSAGQQRYRSMSSHHLKGSDIILLVYDVSATYDDNGLTYWLAQIDNYAQHQNVILIGNKKDLTKPKKYISEIPEQDSSSNQIKKKDQANKPALLQSQLKAISLANWSHLKISCLENDNLDTLWQAIISKSQNAMPHKKMKQKSVIISNTSKLANSKMKSTGNTGKGNKDKCC